MTGPSLAPTPFEQFAVDRGYDLAPAVSPCDLRIYADRSTQDAYEAYTRGQADVARMLTESTLETVPLVEKIRKLAEST